MDITSVDEARDIEKRYARCQQQSLCFQLQVLRSNTGSMMARSFLYSYDATLLQDPGT